jgi:hypothetical protein
MTRKLIFIALLILIPAHLKAQDILLSLTGKEIPCVINKVDTFFVFYTKLGPLKYTEKSLVSKITPRQLIMKDGSTQNVVFDMGSFDPKGPYIFYREAKGEMTKDRYNYFSCTINSFDTLLPGQDTIALVKTEKVLYAQDSSHVKFELSTEDQRAYTYGRRSARINFHSPWSTLGGIAAGFSGGVVLNFFYAVLPPLAYVSINSAIKPKMGKTSATDEPYKTNEYFEDGYRQQARLLKVKNSIFGAVPALGFGILIRLFNQ